MYLRTGTLELNLNSMPLGTKKASQCDLSKIPDGNEKSKDIKMVSLFDQRRIRGYWPCYNDETGVKELTVCEKSALLVWEKILRVDASKTRNVCVALVCPAKRRSHGTPVN